MLHSGSSVVTSIAAAMYGSRESANQTKRFALRRCRDQNANHGTHESFEDWPMFTWSFGCTRVLPPSAPPNRSVARFAITSQVHVGLRARTSLPHNKREMFIKRAARDLHKNTSMLQMKRRAGTYLIARMLNGRRNVRLQASHFLIHKSGSLLQDGERANQTQRHSITYISDAKVLYRSGKESKHQIAIQRFLPLSLSTPILLRWDLDRTERVPFFPELA